MARKILLADDSVTAQNMGRKILADAGYEVITVNNGSAALKKIGEQHPDLIVLDVYMPGYSGLEVCQRLKETGETSRIPVLLTVGKLEPFKPEEAKRVRADAYIVKPFEASELLSALSKLEDKVVPRSESSKPGRFARATAAIEEGRYDKTMAVEEDAGWKNRIAFPSKKKEKPKEEEIDTGEIYNPVNKDLRTVVEHKAPESAPAANEAPVNLSALAPEGLPKDVTPEEIAALAAAAAQIKGTISGEVTAAPSAHSSADAAHSQDIQKARGTEEKKDGETEVRSAEPASVPEIAATAPAATFAEQEIKEKTEEKKEAPAIVSTQADAMNAIMGLETQVMAAFDPESGNGSWGHGKSERHEEPMTMAVAAGTTDAGLTSAARWSAVAVALAPEEASLSLEQEMQKAYADFAAAESGHTATAVSAPETQPALAETATPSAVAEPPAAEVAAPLAESQIPATPAPEVAQPLAAVSEAAAEAMSAAAKELEAVAAKYEAENVPTSPEPAADKSLKAAALESPAASAEAPSLAETKVEDKSAENVQPAEQKAEEKVEGQIEEKATTTLDASPESIAAAVTTVFAVPEIKSELSVAETQVGAFPVEETKKDPETALHSEAQKPVATSEIAAESSTEQVSEEPVPVSRASRGAEDMAKRESDTAAAWASWRKIRETGSTPAGETSGKDSEEIPQDRAAMAAAAGAERKPEDVANLDSDPEIASLVDSVLADMRPKIVEEIARKLGKKK